VRADQSPEARQASQALADALFDAWQTNVKAARPKARIAQFAANPPIAAPGTSLASLAVRYGLVDKLGDRLVWSDRIAKLAGRDAGSPADSFRGTDYSDYLAAHPVPDGHGIGVITVAGDIVDGEALAGTAGGDTISRLVLDAVAQKNLKALVVRIDSPGGSALAAEKIRQALLQARKQGLPIIVSMGNVAASGGYWIAMAGDTVFAEPSTITGSIGVFGLLPTFETSLSKIGVTADGVATTPLSGQPDLLRGTNETTDRLLQNGVDDIYLKFTSLVATQRKMPRARVNEIAQGRVWDGGSARQIGLVDRFGTLEDAVAEAAKRAGLDPKSARPVYIDRIPNWFELYARNLQDVEARTALPVDPYSRMIMRQQASFATGVADGLRIVTGPAVQVRCLACPATPRYQNRATALQLLRNKVF
jgi:protease-4